tara:strand:- start:1818 stop:1940 length:123 start_codon:yes stop_codon:yes gene_type:complete
MSNYGEYGELNMSPRVARMVLFVYGCGAFYLGFKVITYLL